MSPSADGLTPAPDLETEIAEEIRRQLANARSNQTSGEVAQRHETVLSNIMLPGQADIEPGEPLDTGTASTTAVPPPADNGQSVTTEKRHRRLRRSLSEDAG